MTKTGAPIQTLDCLSAPSKGWSAAGGVGNIEKVQDTLHSRVQNKKAGKTVQSTTEITARKRKIICVYIQCGTNVFVGKLGNISENLIFLSITCKILFIIIPI